MTITWFIGFMLRHAKEIISHDSQLGPSSGLLLLEPCYSPAQYRTNYCQMLLSNYSKTSHSGNMLAFLLKSTDVSAVSQQIFPCPLQTTSHTKIIFLEWCLPVYLQLLKLFYLSDVFPSTVCFISIHRAYLHSSDLF